MKISTYLFLILTTNFILIFPIVHGGSAMEDITKFGSSITGLLAQQALTVALGAIAFSWKNINRRDAMLSGPVCALNSVFYDYVRDDERGYMFKDDSHHLNELNLLLAYISWFVPCLILFFKNSLLGFLITFFMLIFQVILWYLWEYTETKFIFTDRDNSFSYNNFDIPPTRSIIEKSVYRNIQPPEDDINESMAIEQRATAVEFTTDSEVWRKSFLSKTTHHDIPEISPDPNKAIILLEKISRLFTFILWTISVGIASTDDNLTNVNIFSILIAAICLQTNMVFQTRSELLWPNFPTADSLYHWQSLMKSNIIDSYTKYLYYDERNTRWVVYVLFTKLYPDLFSDKLKFELYGNVITGDDWLPHLLRRWSTPLEQKCLKRYEPSRSTPITCFDYLGINIWLAITMIEQHIFHNCNKHTNHVEHTGEYLMNMRYRSRICILANKHRHCKDIQDILDRIQRYVEANPIIYDAVAEVFPQYQSFDNQYSRFKKSEDVSKWWYRLTQNAVCPGFKIDNALLLIIYIYEMMGTKFFSSHFKYANYLEKLSVLDESQLVKMNDSINQYYISFANLRFYVPCAYQPLPDEMWLSPGENRLEISKGMVSAKIVRMALAKKTIKGK